MSEINKNSINEVIMRLEDPKPPTKKWCCAHLGITYNTKRLAKIIKDHQDDLTRKVRLRKERRGTPVSNAEVKSVLESYIGGESLTAIADGIFRSVSVIKEVITDVGLPLRRASASYFKPEMVPDKALAQLYNEGDLVYSVRYDQPAEINYYHDHQPVHGSVFSIWLMKDKKFAMQPWYELANLQPLKEQYNLIIRSDLWNEQ